MRDEVNEELLRFMQGLRVGNVQDALESAEHENQLLEFLGNLGREEDVKLHTIVKSLLVKLKPGRKAVREARAEADAARAETAAVEDKASRTLEKQQLTLDRMKAKAI